MQIIAVDIGNSSTKIAVEHASEDERWSMNTVFRGNESPDADFVPAEGNEPVFWSVCSVNQIRLNQLEQWVRTHRPHDTFHVIGQDEVALKTDVQSREQLGRDRLVAAWMAVELNENSGPVIVIDAGTAVTIDFVDIQEVFQGGVIFPGAESGFRQLSQHTDALPALSRDNRFKQSYTDVFGKSTCDAILKGVFQSQVAAIKGIVKQMRKRSKHESAVYVTGGGISDIINLLPEEWNDVPDLVLRGARVIGFDLINAPNV